MFTMDLDVSFLNAVCIPSSCSSSDVLELARMTVESYNLTVGNNINCKKRINAIEKKLFGKIEAGFFDFLNFERIL